eukprot:2130790-Amphidinium_carterae.2
MSLEDHNLATMLEDVKTQRVAIVDANYIDYYLPTTIYMNKDLVRRMKKRYKRKNYREWFE